MAVIAVVAPRHVRERAHLVGGERAVGDGDPQHIGVQLQIDAVHQSQRLEFLFRQLPGQATSDLVAEFADALVDEGAVEVVVNVHIMCPQRSPGGAMVGPLKRIRSRRLPGSTRCDVNSTGAT